MKFNYVATQADGRVVKGIRDAESKEEIMNFLTRNELQPVFITPARWRNFLAKFGELGAGRITPTDQIFLTKYLALMLRAGTDLFKALDILIADFKKQSVRYLLSEIKNTLEKGRPFYESFTKHPRDFSPIFINLVKAGELSGNLELTFENLSVMLGKEQELKRKIRSALIYPSLLVVASVAVLTFLVTFALPRIYEVFAQGGVKEIPTFSRVVFSVGLFFAKYVYLIISGTVVFVIAFYIFFFKTRTGRSYFLRFLNHVPVVNRVVQRVAIQRFASTLGYLIKANIPIVDALDLTATAIGHERMSAGLRRIAHEGVAKGLTIGEAFRKEEDFPLVITNLIAVSEKAGHLEEILFTLSTFYESEIDTAVKGLISIIEPAMLIIIGGVVALIALSVIVPIYQLVGQF